MRREKLIVISIAVGFILSVFVGCIQAKEQSDLASKIVRLHVVANSDSEYDQNIKLAVRDAVLEAAPDGRPEEADMIRMEHAAEKCMRRSGCRLDAKVSMENIYFETRHYEGFSLPAGRYDAVRVVIGEGKGRNWWCVIYPALCSEFAKGEEVLDADEISYIQQRGTGYIIRFRLQEMIAKLCEEFL